MSEQLCHSEYLEVMTNFICGQRGLIQFSSSSVVVKNSREMYKLYLTVKGKFQTLWWRALIKQLIRGNCMDICIFNINFCINIEVWLVAEPK